MVEFSKIDVQRNITLPKKYSNELAEFVGILTGDGYMNKHRKYDYVIEISGNAILDKEYLENHVYDLIKNLFNFIPSLLIKKNQNTMNFRMRSKAMFSYLKEIGFKKGRKNRIGIPGWIMKHNKFMINFIRGLFDTDGSLSLKNRNNKIYPVVGIGSKSDLLLKKVQRFIKMNGISSYLSREVQINKRYKKPVVVFRLQVNGYKNCGNWFSLIGSINPRNLLKFKKIGFEGQKQEKLKKAIKH